MPPAANGTMMYTDLVGNDWAEAAGRFVQRLTNNMKRAGSHRYPRSIMMYQSPKNGIKDAGMMTQGAIEDQ
jgi:hypothetical protein